MVYLGEIDAATGAAMILYNLNGEAMTGYVLPEALLTLDAKQRTAMPTR